MSSADVERISQLFKNVKMAPNSRRGSDAGLPKSFHLVPAMNVMSGTMTTTTTGGGSGRESPCQMHFHPPPGVNQERRGSTGNIVWRKGPTHLVVPAGVDMSRRGSTPGDVHLFVTPPSPGHRRDSGSFRKFSTDSIELNESGNKSWNNSVGNIIEEENEGSGGGKTKFVPWTSLEDSQAIRCAEFHPHGSFYAVGSNSKTLRICEYPQNLSGKQHDGVKSPNVLYKKIKHHRGSIYSLAWSPDGNLLATGSNDKTVKLVRFDDVGRQNFNETHEVELSMHDGTVRDLCFIEDLSNKSSLLVSGGAGDCKIYVTDCVTATPFQAFPGHSAPILSLYNWGGVMFCSGSQDKSIRIWDLRSRACVHMFSPLTSSTSSTTKSAVGSVCVDPTGRLLVSGHEDGAVVLYDIRGSRQIQTFKPHGPSDVRSVRFSPKAYYLLSAGYDQRLMLTDLQGDLSLNLVSVAVASNNVIMKNGIRTINDCAHDDKIISARWHPTDFSFISTSADKTVKLWGLPNSL